MSSTVIAIWLGAGGEAHLLASLEGVRREHPSERLILLSGATLPEGTRKLADDIWQDGAARGASGFLARARRLSWASPSHIYDLEQSKMTRFLRFCVWPKPCWHVMPYGYASKEGCGKPLS